MKLTSLSKSTRKSGRSIGLSTILSVVVGLTATACTSPEATTEATKTPTASMAASPTAQPGGSIVDIAIGNPSFSTLVTAVKAAGLTETLSGKGPFTLFAQIGRAHV